jgi:hypothetical protein
LRTLAAWKGRDPARIRLPFRRSERKLPPLETSRLPEKEAMSRHHVHKLIQNLLVAATSLCVGMILARAMGF